MIGNHKVTLLQVKQITNAQLEPNAQTKVSALLFNLTNGFSLENPYFAVFYFLTTTSHLSLLSKAIA